jgi:hypothetical protein
MPYNNTIFFFKVFYMHIVTHKNELGGIAF